MTIPASGPGPMPCISTIVNPVSGPLILPPRPHLIRLPVARRGGPFVRYRPAP